jgi:hypothetical protein
MKTFNEPPVGRQTQPRYSGSEWLRASAGEVKRGSIPDEVDDGRAVAGVVEIGKAEILIGHDELLEMRISVDCARRQPPAQVAERVTGPMLEWLRCRPKIAKGARGDLVEQRFGCTLRAQLRLGQPNIEDVAGRQTA